LWKRLLTRQVADGTKDHFGLDFGETKQNNFIVFKGPLQRQMNNVDHNSWIYGPPFRRKRKEKGLSTI
jgi:hypothetical protein